MILLQQLQNLAYATAVTSWQHLPHFFTLLGMSLLLVTFFFAGSLLLLGKKQNYLLPAYYYVVIAVFVIVVDVLARLGVLYITSILVVGCVFLFGSIFGFWKKRQLLLLWIKTIQMQKHKWMTIFIVVLLSTFFFSKFIYDNGLHDEYQHHAVVEDMLQTKQWPIRDELRYGIDISDYYHYGWYYLVIFVHSVFPVSIEVALDLVKLMLFIPLLPLIYSLLEKYVHTKWYQSISVAVLLLLQGPALFFLDAYTGNVFLSQGNEIVFEPLFFQLAGVTWFGIVSMVAFLAVLYELLRRAQVWHVGLFFIFSVWSLFLLNKAYLLIFVPATISLNFYVYRKAIKTFYLEKKHLLPFFLLSGAVVLFTSLVLIQQISPLLFSLLKGESGIPFVRALQKWGFPYSSQSGLALQEILSAGSLRAFGIVPLLSLLILGKQLFVAKQKYTTVVLLLFTFFLWGIPAVLNFSGSELALNKFYIPALWVSTLVVISWVLSQNKKIQMFIVSLLVSSVIASSAYFTSISLPNSYRYWDYSDNITEYLSNRETLIVASIDDSEYAKHLINTLHIQLLSANATNKDFFEEIKYVITTERRSDQEPLAHTDTHFLYQK
jgi:hypothetical protein